MVLKVKVKSRGSPTGQSQRLKSGLRCKASPFARNQKTGPVPGQVQELMYLFFSKPNSRSRDRVGLPLWFDLLSEWCGDGECGLGWLHAMAPRHRLHAMAAGGLMSER